MLVDTNVWSELLRLDPLPAVVALLGERRDELFLSAIVLAEMEYGVAKLVPSARRTQLRSFVDGIRITNAERILPLDSTAAQIFGETKARLRVQGEPIADMDLLIAAQAIAAEMPLVTRNVADMGRTGATIIDPWQS